MRKIKKKNPTKCKFCDTNIDAYLEPVNEHLVVTRNRSSNHLHVHGDVDNSECMKEMIECAIQHTNLEGEFYKGGSTDKQPPKEIVFRNRQRIGDSLMFTAGVRDFKSAYPDVRVNVISTAMHIWDNNPYVDNTLVPTEENTLNIGPSYLTNASNRVDWHFANAYRTSMCNELGIPQINPLLAKDVGNLTRPDIWLTQEEYDAPPPIDVPYWIITVGGEKGWGCKMYPFERWQEFVEQNPQVTFVQIGTREDGHPKLQGANIIDYIGKTQDKDTGIRDLFKLFLNMEGGVGLVSFGMHLASAFQKPYIVIAGAREPRSFTAYPGQQYLSTDGCLPCGVTACWRCDINGCPSLVINTTKEHEMDRKIPSCVDIIYPEDITHALDKYYLGGRLKLNKRLEKPKAQIAKVAKVHAVSPITDKPNLALDEGVQNDNDLAFGGDSLTEQDWVFIESVLDTYKPKAVLEFGASLSTLLLNKKVENVVTYETMEDRIKKIKGIDPKCTILQWNGKEIEEDSHYDFAFVDGPSGAQNREWSTQFAAEHADIVIVHDAGRENERRWQFRYLKENFVFNARGGSRCHLWVRKGKYEDVEQNFKISNVPQQVHLDRIIDTLPADSKANVVKVEQPKKEWKPSPARTGKVIKFVFNGRGEGGAERSCTWMMNTLWEMGHSVTYLTPNDRPCGTWRKEGNPSIPVKFGLDSFNGGCDILVLYGNDWIWEFGRPDIAEAFGRINSARKVMCINYKMGKIGQAEWTKEWDEYLFLNSTLKDCLLERTPRSETSVMAPPTILDNYYDITPSFEKKLALIRHSSQGDAKYPRNFNEVLEQIKSVRKECTLSLMPAPSFLTKHDWVTSYQRNNPPVKEFLTKGNCFWYMLPGGGYTEGGPKVVMEAQASGLPVIADNHSGMKDRVVAGTGWLCDSLEDHLSVIKTVSMKELEECGKNAREHAKTAYDPMLWINHILGI